MSDYDEDREMSEAMSDATDRYHEQLMREGWLNPDQAAALVGACARYKEILEEEGISHSE